MKTSYRWLVLVVVVLCSACSDNDKDLLLTTSNESTGGFVFKLSKSEIPPEVGKITVRLERDGGILLTKSVFVANFVDTVRIEMTNVPAGNLSLTVNAGDSSGTIQYSGTSLVTVVENQTVGAVVHMSRIGGTGTVEIFVVWETKPELGKSFEIKYGQTVILQDVGIPITFKSVEEDSRCPLGAICVWQGNAKVIIQVSQVDITLNTVSEPKEAAYLNYLIQLLAVHPYPSVVDSLKPKDYSIALLVTRDSTMKNDSLKLKSMKGWELYSWEKPDGWYYALVEGTNRIKTFKEISAADVAVQGAEALKGKLVQLAAEEQIHWLTKHVSYLPEDFSNTEFPPEDTVNEVKAYCATHRLHLFL